MNKNTIISLVIILVGVVSLVWWSKSIEDKKSGEVQAKSHPARIRNALSADETFYDFGVISMKNGNVSKIFKVTNSGEADIKIPSVTTSCMCTTAYIVKNGVRSRPFGMPGHGGAVPEANAIVKVGESLYIEVEYNPNAHGPAGVGLIERSVYLKDENNSVIEFKFKVNVTP